MASTEGSFCLRPAARRFFSSRLAWRPLLACCPMVNPFAMIHRVGQRTTCQALQMQPADRNMPRVQVERERGQAAEHQASGLERPDGTAEAAEARLGSVAP